VAENNSSIMAEKKKKDTVDVIDGKKLATLEARLEGMKEELEEAKTAQEEATKASEASKTDFLRLMAEFDTFRRRTAEEKLALVSSASADTIKGLLPILDDCEIALANLEKSTDSEAAKEGTQLIFNKLTNYLKGKGLERIEAKGKDFDTELHEAVTTFPAPSEDLKGKVIDVVQTGYTLGGKVLRYAKVVVGA
jgi:molecular chaperone GrpE